VKGMTIKKGVKKPGTANIADNNNLIPGQTHTL
jgi:hypothetical protein